MQMRLQMLDCFIPKERLFLLILLEALSGTCALQKVDQAEDSLLLAQCLRKVDMFPVISQILFGTQLHLLIAQILWFQKSAHAGNVKAMNALGTILWNGVDLPKV